MSGIVTPNEKLDTFVDSLIPETNLSPTEIARKFSLFHQLSSPPKYNQIIDACFAFVGDLQEDNLPDTMRGFHFIYNDHIQITLKKRERTSGIAHTLLHELFEIIIEKLNEKKTPPYELTQYKANLFAASVLMPKEEFFKFSLDSNLDFMAIRDKYLHLSCLSLLLRLRYLFGINKICYLGVVVENKKAHYHKDYPGNRNNLSNFEITTVTRSPEDSITFNNKALLEFLSRCHEKIIAQKDEYKKSITLEEGDFLIKASPFMYHKYDAIKTIVMQILPKKDYETILRKVVKKS